MKKGKGHVVQHVSHKNAEKKKEKKFWKGKNAKVSFKKSGFTSVPEIEESSGMKPKFQGKCKFGDIFGHKQADCFKFKNWLEKKKKGNPLALVCFESNLVDVPSNTWWLDPGATIHVTNSLQELKTRRRLSDGELSIVVGNGVNVGVENIETTSLKLSSGFG